jgi:K+-transporting ATPase KdpF subunit
MSILDWIAGISAALLGAYLLFALIVPERLS